MFQTSTMANLETGFHELLTCPGAKYDEGMSDLKMSKSHANVF